MLFICLSLSLTLALNESLLLLLLLCFTTSTIRAKLNVFIGQQLELAQVHPTRKPPLPSSLPIYVLAVAVVVVVYEHLL